VPRSIHSASADCTVEPARRRRRFRGLHGSQNTPGTLAALHVAQFCSSLLMKTTTIRMNATLMTILFVPLSSAPLF
jgi:hypothetical protein